MFDLVRRWTQTEHEACQDNLSAWLDGQLSARERSRVQRHLQECKACREDLESLRRTVSLLRSVPMLQPPRSFFIGAGEVAKQGQVRRRRLSYVYLQAATAVATMLLVLVVSGDAILRFQPVQPAAQMSGEAVVSAPADVSAETVPVESLDAGQMDEVLAAAAEEPTAPSTAPRAEALLKAPEAAATETLQAVLQHETGQAEALPSMTFGRPAEAPVPPTLGAGAAPAYPEPTAEPLSAVAPTETPQPTSTPAPTTPTPPPTATPVPPTEVPTSIPTAAPLLQTTADSAEKPIVQPISPTEPRSLLETLRSSFSWIEAILATTVAVLLIVLLWLRARL